MRFPCLSSLLCAALAIPGFGQVAEPVNRTPAFQVILNVSSPNFTTNNYFNSGFGFLNVFAIRGLSLDAILNAYQATGQGTSQPALRPGEFAFVRIWDGQPLLANAVGQDLTNPQPFQTFLQVAEDSNPSHAVLLNNPVFNDWTLMVQRGAFCTESVRLGYTGWMVH